MVRRNPLSKVNYVLTVVICSFTPRASQPAGVRMTASTTSNQTARAPGADDAAIGANLKTIRTSRGLTQEQLASLAGLSWQSIQKYEKGVGRITAARMQQLAGILHCTAADFLGEGDATALPEVGREHLDLVRDFNAISDSTDREAVRGLVRKLASKTGEPA